MTTRGAAAPRTYKDNHEPGEPEVVVLGEGQDLGERQRGKAKRGPVAAFDLVPRPLASVSLLQRWETTPPGP